MIATLVKKDFLTNLVSPRFAIGFVLCLVLIPFSILINISDYRDRATPIPARPRRRREGRGRGPRLFRAAAGDRPAARAAERFRQRRLRPGRQPGPDLARGQAPSRGGQNGGRRQSVPGLLLLRRFRRHRGHRLLAPGAPLQLRRLHPREGGRHAEAPDVQFPQPVDALAGKLLGILATLLSDPRLLVPPERASSSSSPATSPFPPSSGAGSSCSSRRASPISPSSFSSGSSSRPGPGARSRASSSASFSGSSSSSSSPSSRPISPRASSASPPATISTAS